MILPRIDPDAPPSHHVKLVARLHRKLSTAQICDVLGLDRKTVQNRLAVSLLIPEVLRALDAKHRGDLGLSWNQVRGGGFFLPGRGSNDGRMPALRRTQLRLLRELRGKARWRS